MEDIKRDNTWLEEKLYTIWEEYFADIPRKNMVLIKFGRSSARQLGSIKWAGRNARIKHMFKSREVQEYYENQDDKRITIITITSKFKDVKIPEYVVLLTIAHELTHYAHGFSSPLSQSYIHPHKGGIIHKELAKRGLGELHKKAKKWIKDNWRDYLLS